MSSATLLLLLTPLLLPFVIAGAVIIVALCRANPEDVPAVMQESAALFRRVLRRTPNARLSRPAPREVHNDGADNQLEEAS